MTTDAQETLWNDLFADEALARVRTSTLTAGLGATRARRTRKKAAMAAATLAVAGSLVTAMSIPHSSPPPGPPVALQPTSSLTMINDEQLLILLAGQHPALLGSGATKTLVFIDH